MPLLSTVSRSNWNLEMLVSVEGGKPEYPEKNPRSKDENQQQTQPLIINRGVLTTFSFVKGGHGKTKVFKFLPYPPPPLPPHR